MLFFSKLKYSNRVVSILNIANVVVFLFFSSLVACNATSIGFDIKYRPIPTILALLFLIALIYNMFSDRSAFIKFRINAGSWLLILICLFIFHPPFPQLSAAIWYLPTGLSSGGWLLLAKLRKKYS